MCNKYNISGTRIVYERAFLMQMRQSPLAKTPPANLPVIPGVTCPASTSPNKNCSTSPKKHNDSGSDVISRTSSMDVPTKLQTVTGKKLVYDIHLLYIICIKFLAFLLYPHNYNVCSIPIFQKIQDQKMINLVLICK